MKRISMRRRLAIALVVFSLLLAGCGAAGGQPAKTTRSRKASLSVLTFPSALVDEPLYVALKEGYFAENHLHVTLVPITNGPASIAALESNSIQMNYGQFELLLSSNAKGFGLQAVVDTVDANLYELIAKRGMPLPNLDKGYPDVMKDFVGKTIGITAVGSAEQFEVEALFAGAGLPTNSATFVGVGVGASEYSALLSGKVDAVYASTPAPAMIRDKRIGTVALNLEPATVGPRLLQAARGAYFPFFAKKSYIRAHPATIKAFVNSITDAVKWLKNRKNQSAAVSIAESFITLSGFSDPAAILSASLQTMRPEWGYTVSKSALQAGEKFMLHFGLLTKPININQSIWSGAPR